jgi:hypothetical protein
MATAATYVAELLQGKHAGQAVKTPNQEDGEDMLRRIMV